MDARAATSALISQGASQRGGTCATGPGQKRSWSAMHGTQNKAFPEHEIVPRVPASQWSAWEAW